MRQPTYLAYYQIRFLNIILIWTESVIFLNFFFYMISDKKKKKIILKMASWKQWVRQVTNWQLMLPNKQRGVKIKYLPPKCSGEDIK